jgi:hypothetical protein
MLPSSFDIGEIICHEKKSKTSMVQGAALQHWTIQKVQKVKYRSASKPGGVHGSQ